MSSATEEAPFLIEPEPGIRLQGYYHTVPSGPIGIFVHGFLSDCGGAKSRAFAEHARERGYAWLRFDQRGHGRSDGSVKHLRISRLLADLEVVLDYFAPRPIVLVGSSMGGWLSVLAAQARPQRVAGLLLIAPAFNFIRHHLAALPAADRTDWARTDAQRFASRYDSGAYELEYAAVADAEKFDVTRGKVELNCPTIVVHGEQDEAVPLAVSEEFLNQLRAPYREFHVVPRGDHRLSEAIPLLLTGVDALWGRIAT